METGRRQEGGALALVGNVIATPQDSRAMNPCQPTGILLHHSGMTPKSQRQKVVIPQRQDSRARTGMVEAHVGQRGRHLRRRTGLGAVAPGHGRSDPSHLSRHNGSRDAQPLFCKMRAQLTKPCSSEFAMPLSVLAPRLRNSR